MARYAVVDWYEAPEGNILGIELTYEEAHELAWQQVEDTDGECEVRIYDNEMERSIYYDLYDRIYS